MEITDDDILDALKSLNTNKASAGNLTANHLKHGAMYILSYIRKLFNRIFQSGEFPEQWTTTLLIPIHIKGPKDDPDDFRGISLIDVLSKLYIYIVNKRLTFYCNILNKITEAQSGFRAEYSTIDNAFILNALISKHLCNKGGRLYVAFVDFKKASIVLIIMNYICH
jgi:hypothetical protein